MKIRIPLKYKLARLTFLFISIFVFQSQTKAQNSWKELADVSFKTKFDESGKYPIQYPIFGEKVKNLDNKEITLKGFMVPLDDLKGDNFFVLSMLPFNICYFCGGAGPETVIEVHTNKPYRFTEETVYVKGRLKINESDPAQLMYVLESATVLD